MAKKLRIGIIGTGGISHSHIAGYQKLANRVEVVAACDINEPKLTAYCKQFGIPKQYTDYNECFSEDWNDRGEWKRSEDHDRYIGMMSAFGKMVTGERENPYTYDYELELYRTVLKCCE